MDREFMDQLWSERSYGTPLAITFMIIPTVSIALRFYAKFTAHRPIEVADYLSVTAWLFTVAFLVCMLVAVYLPGAFTADGIDTDVSKITFTLNLLWVGGCYFCKLSILCVYYSLLTTPSSRFRWAVRGVFVLTACVGAASALGFLLIFKDMSWWWTTGLRQHPSAMVEELKMNLAVDIMSLLTDFIIIVMPLPVLLKLSLSKHKKRVLVVLFSLGFLTCIVVIIRIITTYGFNGALDAIQIQCLLMALEPAMGVSICSLPVFLRLFRKSKPQGSSYYHSASGNPGSFFPLEDSATKRLRQDHDEILLRSIDAEPVQQPRAVRVKKEIIIQSSVVGDNSSHDTLKDFSVANSVRCS